MAVVFTDVFTEGSNTNLEARANWEREAGNNTAGELLVNAASDWLTTATGGFGVARWGSYRCTASGLPTGVQQVSATLRVSSVDDWSGVILRMDAAADTGYLFTIRSVGGGAIYERTAGANGTALASGGTVTSGTQYACVAVADEDSLSWTVGANTPVATSDSTLTAGVQGAFLHYHGTQGTTPILDTFEVDDMDAGGDPEPDIYDLTANVVTLSTEDPALPGPDNYDLTANVVTLSTQDPTLPEPDNYDLTPNEITLSEGGGIDLQDVDVFTLTPNTIGVSHGGALGLAYYPLTPNVMQLNGRTMTPVAGVVVEEDEEGIGIPWGWISAPLSLPNVDEEYSVPA